MKKRSIICLLIVCLVLFSGCAPEPGTEIENDSIVERYQELASTYVDDKEPEKAIEILQKGYLETGNEELLQFMKELEHSNHKETFDDNSETFDFISENKNRPPVNYIDQTSLYNGNFSVGDHVFLGAFEQDGNTANGSEDIEWIILEKTDSDVLLLSAQILYCIPYSNDDYEHQWDLSYVRNWLNTDFLNTAFTDDVREQITATRMENGVYNATYDRVFCLTAEEGDLFFQDDSSRKALPTDFALEISGTYNTGIDVTEQCSSYWTVTECDNCQYVISDNGKNRVLTSASYPAGVRPAIRISRSGVVTEPTKLGFDVSATGNYEGLSWHDIIDVCIGSWHILGLKTDGTVVAEPHPWGYAGEACVVSGWTDITKIAAGNGFSIGLKKDGTAVSNGICADSIEIDVSSWRDIKDVYANEGHAVGLKWDGTVVATGWNDYGQCDVSSWSDIQKIAVGDYFTIGLKNDGTVVSSEKRFDVASWTNICEINAGGNFVIGRESNGFVHLAYYNQWGEFDVSGWNSVTRISTGYYGSLALTHNGNVLGSGISTKVEDGYAFVSDETNNAYVTDAWENIVQVYAGDGDVSAGLTFDGSIVIAKDKDAYPNLETTLSSWIKARKVYTSFQGTVIGMRYPQ